MKKTIIMLLSLAGIAAGADDVTLRYSLTQFNDGEPANTATDAGTTSVDHSGYVNWRNQADIGGRTKGVAHLHGGARFSIGSASSGFGGINAGGSDVLNTTDGFTLVFNGYAPAEQNWGDFLSFTVGSTQYKFETANSSTTNVFIFQKNESESGGSPIGKTNVSGVDRGTWYNYALTVSDKTSSVASYTLSVWDSNGTLIGEKRTFEGATGNLNYLREGSAFDEHWEKDHLLDNFGLYDGVLTDDDLAALVRSEAAGTGMIQSFEVIPEPATATLSLLALAGLAVRRRRK